MTDQLANWLLVIIETASLILSIITCPRKTVIRRTRRVLRYRHLKVWGIERTSVDVIDDSRL
ncbi:MAG: hypothetical protein WB710_06425 [Stellaceae bacterium]